jgi:cell division protein FtsN
MEQQKVLWIVFSVTLFLVVVVVVGFVWFLPSEKESEPGELVAGVETSSKVFDPIVWVRDDEEVPGMSEEADTQDSTGETGGDLLLVYGEAGTQVETAVTSFVGENGSGAGGRTVETQSPVVPRVVATPIAETAISVPSIAHRVEPESTDVRITETRSPAATVETPAAEQLTQYWIQAGSFQSQSRAEQTQSKLAEKGWNTRIISRDLSGQIYFRVRLGPFDTKGEAGKFLDWITDIESFESSYISQVYTTRAIN